MATCEGSGTLVPQDSTYRDGKRFEEQDGTEVGPVTGFCPYCEEDDFELVSEVAHGWHLPDHVDRYA